MSSFSHLNVDAVRISDMRSVQFDVRDRYGEVVSIASDIYINIQFTYSTNRFYYICLLCFNLTHFALSTMVSNEQIKKMSILIIINSQSYSNCSILLHH
mgnify:FL=1